MKLLPVACLCLLTLSADANGAAAVLMVVEEDSDVVLPCSLSDKEDIEFKLFDWKKAAQKDEPQKEVFLYDAGVHYNNRRDGQSEQFKGRVLFFQEELKNGNASIKIRKAEIRDSGDYTCDFPRLQPRQTFLIELIVNPILKDRTEEKIPGASPKPHVSILYETNDQARLQCEVQGASPKPEVEWKDSSGNKLPAEENALERDGKFYVTLKTTVYKTGNYSCVSTQRTIYHQIYSQTFVGIGGASPQPIIKTRETNDWAQLQCEVRGAFPKPEVEWKDSSGNKLPAEENATERDGKFYVTLKKTVYETGNYSCVSTQRTINHQTEEFTFVLIGGASSHKQSGFTVLAVAAVLGSLPLWSF